MPTGKGIYDEDHPDKDEKADRAKDVPEDTPDVDTADDAREEPPD
ncbi:hypothetical protein [Mycolicibacterium sp. HK-90]|nr:hypothetical protein [Mycolicibacterium sp. HK-90]WKG03075.1 hypothetical protein QU592_28470 [Mycolicibacterium sp. HK-90]